MNNLKRETRKKLRAFTIVETIIAMGISSLVISIGYTGYGLVSQMYGSFKKSSDKITELVLLDRLLTEDFSNADLILRNENKVAFTMRKGNIEYIFENEYILRRGVLTDTFFVSPEPITYEDAGINSSGRLVKSISFTCAYKDMEENFNYVKVYGANTMINFTKQDLKWE